MAHDIGALTREWFEQVWNRRDESVMARMSSPDVVTHGLAEDGGPVKGVEHFKQFWRAFLAAFPDMTVKVEDVLVDGDKTVTRLSFSGTHSGEGIGIPPTGRRFASTAIVIARWENGRCVESWNEFDAAGMMRQLQTPTAKLRT
jgi:predicted ester cyclase